jgi:hypothetical protein
VGRSGLTKKFFKFSVIFISRCGGPGSSSE